MSVSPRRGVALRGASSSPSTLAAAVVIVGVVLLAFSGGAAAVGEPTDVEGVDEVSVDGESPGDVPIDERAADPLDNETGTTEVVVRFTPIDDPDAEGAAAVDELRNHADDEQEAFERFADETDHVTIHREFWLANALLVSVDANETDSADLRSVANVTDVHDNVVVATHDGVAIDPTLDGSNPTREQVDADPAGPHTQGLELIAVPTAWDRFDTRGAGATVAVIDTGVDPGHQDIELAAWADFDENGTLVSDDVTDATDPDGHGTHVAGTVAGGNASGTHIGVAPDASIHGINAFGEDGSATFAGVLAAMEHATADEDVDVLQMSLGATGTFRGFIAPVRNARAAGAIVVAASGNEGENTSSAPANVHDALAVGAVRSDENRTVAEFSSGEEIDSTEAFGEFPDDWPARYVVPDVTAPGVGVISAESGTTDGYVRQQGTSMASPHVSGLAALAVAATDSRIEPDGLQASLVETAVHPGGPDVEPDHRHGHGVVDAPGAVAAAVDAAPPPDPEPAGNGGTDANRDETAEDDPPVGDDTPGFGPVPAVVAILIALVASVIAGRFRDGNGTRGSGPPGSP